MSARTQSRNLLALALITSACSKTSHDAPLGEVVLSIDTDAPVPDFVGRLRIDIFDEGGQWLQYSDIARTSAADWPASFSLYTRDDETPRKVLVRVRGYLEGRVRDYRGERFHERKPYVEPWAADTLAELCANVPELVLGEELTLRHGSRTLSGANPNQAPDELDAGHTACWAQMAGGVVAARLNVAQAAEYRIETTGYRALDPNLFIRKDCRDPLTELACSDDIGGGAYLWDDNARLVLQLEPGSYTVMAGSYVSAADDVTLRADLAANWVTAPAPLLQDAAGSLPRLVVAGVDTTPEQEPQPLVTIDRLALLQLVPGKKQLASIVLRTACGGTMAKLSAAGSDAAPVLAEAETCVGIEGERAPLVPEAQEPFARLPTSTLAGTFKHGEACPTAASQDRAACVPAGTFVLGAPLFLPREVRTTPERFALMNRYWLDKTEVTVARFRSALARGLRSTSFTPVANDGPLSDDAPDDPFRHCTFSTTPEAAGQPREGFPLNCLEWSAARAFCRFEGGDLPSEAQWQYAASRAGRDYELDDFCSSTSEAGCLAVALDNPVAVSDPLVAVEATPFDILGLYGNVSEWTLDSFYALDSACWDGATLLDPMCWEKRAPLRTVAGGSWGLEPGAVWRYALEPTGGLWVHTLTNRAVGMGSAFVGFRCAYTEEPK